MSNSKNGPPPIVYIAGALAIAGVGYTAFNKFSNPPAPIVSNNTGSDRDRQNSETKLAFDVPSALPSGTGLKIGGATSLAQIDQALKIGFEKKFPGVQALYQTSSSGRGVTDLVSGSIDISGISRELTAAEKAQGLVSVPIITEDKIAIVIGTDNALRTGLTSDQVTKIFTGELTNWSQVGGRNLLIRPILRPVNSGTHQSFQEVGLKGKNFGSGGSFLILERDATTPLLQALGADGIGYATFAQVAKQSTVRSIAIDGITPDAANYPYKRTLAYVYKGQPNDAVKAFLGFATSSEGQQLITQQAQSK
jgi:phosphate transport system substrate-binding protein